MSDEPLQLSEPSADDPSYFDDVLEVWKHIKGSYGEKKAGYTPTRKWLHDWATATLNDGKTMPNIEKFMKMVEAAEKNRKTKKEESVQELGRKGLAELKATLAEMIEAAK